MMRTDIPVPTEPEYADLSSEQESKVTADFMEQYADELWEIIRARNWKRLDKIADIADEMCENARTIKEPDCFGKDDGTWT